MYNDRWGKHLFGKGVEVQSSGGGGGSNEEDQKLLEELKKKYGDKALEMFKKIKQQQQTENGRYGLADKIRERVTGEADPDNIRQVHDRVYERTLKSANSSKYSAPSGESNEQYARRLAKETAEKQKKYVKDHSIAGAIEKGKKALNLGGSLQVDHNVSTSANTSNKNDSTTNRPRSRKRNVTGEGTGVKVGQSVNNKKVSDRVEQQVYDKSAKALLDKITKKRR